MSRSTLISALFLLFKSPARVFTVTTNAARGNHGTPEWITSSSGNNGPGLAGVDSFHEVRPSINYWNGESKMLGPVVAAVAVDELAPETHDWDSVPYSRGGRESWPSGCDCADCRGDGRPTVAWIAAGLLTVFAAAIACAALCESCRRRRRRRQRSAAGCTCGGGESTDDDDDDDYADADAETTCCDEESCSGCCGGDAGSV